MKKSILLVVVLAACIVTNAQNVNIPDANFKNYLVNNLLINTNNDSEIQTSEAAAFNGNMFCHLCGIADLTGIETFTSLKSIKMQSNLLTSVDVSACVALTKLDLVGNELESLNVSGCLALDTLDCSYNDYLTNLDISNNNALKWLYCNGNLLPSLSLGNKPALEVLNCGYNQLTELDVSQCPVLYSLSANDNNLTSLDLSLNPNLALLFTSYNDLTYLNVANGNNPMIDMFYAAGNPNLSCIQVDDAAFSEQNWLGVYFGFDESANFSESCVVGVSSTEKKNSLDIFPNPTTSFINVWTDENIQINVFNQVGKIVESQKLSRGNNRIELSHLTSGVYFLRDENGQIWRIIKE